MMSRNPSIAIIGGGPGGLALARLLDVRGLKATVFERDAHSLDRPQGGSLDLHHDSGLRAVEQAGLMPAFLKVARYDDQGERLLDYTGRVHFDHQGAGTDDRPEIDRTELRHLFLNALPGDCVRWNSVVTAVEPAGSQWNVLINAKSAGAFDLVVGADGLWSRARPLVSSYKPQYSGLTFIEFGIDDIDRAHPALAALIGRGKVGIHGNGREIIVQRNGNSHARGYAIFRVPADWSDKRFDFASPASVRVELLSEFGDFADEIRGLFRAATDRFIGRQIYALPVGHHWSHRPGLTLIGDAAHVMSPFGGEGVNAALLDAARLSEFIAGGDDLSSAVRAYEEEMFQRVEDVARDSADAAATVLSHDSLNLTLSMYREHLGLARGDQADVRLELPGFSGHPIDAVGASLQTHLD